MFLLTMKHYSPLIMVIMELLDTNNKKGWEIELTIIKVAHGSFCTCFVFSIMIET
jgi:hypothetical protein